MQKPWCSKCDKLIEANRYGKSRYCKSCGNENSRKNRVPYKELSADEKQKGIARSYLKEYVKRGKIIKQPCEYCGNQKSEGHHSDYLKPLEVTWLCRQHHLDLHKNLISLNR